MVPEVRAPAAIAAVSNALASADAAIASTASAGITPSRAFGTCQCHFELQHRAEQASIGEDVRKCVRGAERVEQA